MKAKFILFIILLIIALVKLEPSNWFAAGLVLLLTIVAHIFILRIAPKCLGLIGSKPDDRPFNHNKKHLPDEDDGWQRRANLYFRDSDRWL